MPSVEMMIKDSTYNGQSPRLFLHPEYCQLWANSVQDVTGLSFPKYSEEMQPVCDVQQYHNLVEFITDIIENKMYFGKQYLWRWSCFPSLRFCFFPKPYLFSKKNKDHKEQEHIQTSVSASVEKYTKSWRGAVTIRREISNNQGKQEYLQPIRYKYVNWFSLFCF